MSLQQALLARVPLAQKQAELQKVMYENRYFISYHHLDTSQGFCPSPDFVERCKEARQAFFVAQDQLARMK